MRGAVQYEDTFNLTPTERQLMFDFIEQRLEIEGKKTVPIY